MVAKDVIQVPHQETECKHCGPRPKETGNLVLFLLRNRSLVIICSKQIGNTQCRDHNSQPEDNLMIDGVSPSDAMSAMSVKSHQKAEKDLLAPTEEDVKRDQ